MLDRQSKLLLGRLQLLGDGAAERRRRRRRGGAAPRRWRGEQHAIGKRWQCIFARVVLKCAMDLANLCILLTIPLYCEGCQIKSLSCCLILVAMTNKCFFSEKIVATSM